MRNFLDTASIAQSLDGERLMGRLHYPDRRIASDQSGYKLQGATRSVIYNETRLLTGLGILLSPHSLHDTADFTRVCVDDSYQLFDGEVAVSL
jgi:hypothetical protein